MTSTVEPLAQGTLRPRGLQPRTSLLGYAVATAAVMLVLHLVAFGMSAAALLAFAVFASGVTFLWLRIPVDYPHTRFGACNAVTLLRAGLGASLLTPLLAGDPTRGSFEEWAVVIVAATVLALDGIDGLLARRSGLASAYGARFDMEVDAALSLILALHVFVDGSVGPFVLVLGVIRYVFIAASVPLPWLSARLPERFGRKLVCVIQVATLIALQVPILSPAWAQVIAVSAALALLWSFGRDTLWLWRHRT